MEKNKQKDKIVLAGVMNWEEFRDKLIENLKSCKTEEDFLKIIKRILFSASRSEEEMQEKRRFLGIPET